MPINLLKVGVNLKIQEANEDRRNDYVNNHDKPNSKNTWIFWKFWLVSHSFLEGWTVKVCCHIFEMYQIHNSTKNTFSFLRDI